MMPEERSTADVVARKGEPMLAYFAAWILRLVNTALLAAGVWALLLIVDRLDNLTGEVINLIDYLSVIAERLG